MARGTSQKVSRRKVEVDIKVKGAVSPGGVPLNSEETHLY